MTKAKLLLLILKSFHYMPDCSPDVSGQKGESKALPRTDKETQTHTHTHKILALFLFHSLTDLSFPEKSLTHIFGCEKKRTTIGRTAVFGFLEHVGGG